MNKSSKIAVIGSGISGLATAYLLNKNGYDVSLFEKDTRLGGHTHTTPTDIDGKNYNIDSGFIVFNDWTYPNFIKLMDELGVESQPTNMSFSTFERNGDFVYSGSGFAGLFSRKSYVYSPQFLRMLIDIVRFNKRAIADYKAGRISSDLSLEDYLAEKNYGKWFINRYILPMGAAIWSSSSRDIAQFPALFFVRFFHHHGLLNIINRPQWRVIKNGSASYIDALQGKLGTVKLNAGVETVERQHDKVTITTSSESLVFDEIIFACHSDQALKILGESATDAEKTILGEVAYRENAVTAHLDESLLPRQDSARSSWNVSLSKDLDDIPMLTYYMNKLQNFHHCPQHIAVSVNCDDIIDNKSILYQESYSHPMFTTNAIQAQAKHSEISGYNRTHYCGAYWFNGFHEDGLKSAIRVCEQMGISW